MTTFSTSGPTTARYMYGFGVPAYTWYLVRRWLGAVQETGETEAQFRYLRQNDLWLLRVTVEGGKVEFTCSLAPRSWVYAADVS